METQLSEILINGTSYVRKDQAPEKEPSGDLKIVILQRGWVMVGRFSRSGSECKLTVASVIRNWGTTKGVGELAKDGPNSNTKLDKCNGLVEFDWLTVVAVISCDEAKWVSKL